MKPAALGTLLLLLLAACAVGAPVGQEPAGPEVAQDPPLVVSPTPAPAQPERPAPPRPPAPRDDPPPDSAPPPAPDAALPPDAASPPDAAAPPDTSAPPPDASGVAQADVGEIVISEVLFDPNGTEPDGEWIEIANLAAGPRTLRDLTLRDGSSRTKVIDEDVVVPAGGFVVLARSRSGATAQGVPAGAVAYEYGAGLSSSAGVILTNGSTGSVAISRGATELSRVPYGTFGLGAAAGKSLQLRALAATPVGVASQYCVSASPYGSTGHMGTPGAGPSCP